MSTKYLVGEIATFQGRTGRVVEARKNDQGYRVLRREMNSSRGPGQWVSNLGTGSDDMYRLEEDDTHTYPLDNNLFQPDPIQEFILENCGPLEKIHWCVSPNINLIIGENGTGKSLLLKILYAALRSTEAYQRGDDKRSFTQILGERLRGTFQLEQIGDLVRKGTDRLRFECKFEAQQVYFSFTPSAARGVREVSEIIETRANALSLFLPPKEILSLMAVIKKSRLQDQIFGFDDTYLDLAIALEGIPRQEKDIQSNFAQARNQLSEIYKGKVIRVGGNWLFKQGNTKYSIHTTAEGVKRLALLDILISNHSLTPGSVLFIDEPEAMLHPKAITGFMEILYLLSSQGTQIFMASHSYFVLKLLYIIAKRENLNIQVLSLTSNSQPTIENLREGIPDNPIIDESIALYERELDVEL